MNIISSVSSTESGEAQFAFIQLTKDSAKFLLRLRESCKPLFGLVDFYGVEFFDYTPTLYSEDPGISDENLDGRWIKAEKGWMPVEGTELAVDCSVLTIKKDGILWRLSIKHSAENCETCEIDWDTIEEAAK